MKNRKKCIQLLSFFLTLSLVVMAIEPLNAQGVLFQNTSGDTLAYIADEGTKGSLKIKPGVAPSNMTNKLYNVGGILHWGSLPLSHMWNKNGSHVYYNDGKVGIGEMVPTADLEVNGIDGVLFEGTYGSGTTPKEGIGTRMMWYPKKAAFRAGYVNGDQWDDVNIGNYSIAMGNSTSASGNYSTALGNHTTASGFRSTAMGHLTTASKESSTAMGYTTTASGDYSTAMGSATTASGFYSTAMGVGTEAIGSYSTAMGRYTTARGHYSTSLGNKIEAEGDFTFAIGLDDVDGKLVSQDHTMAIMGGKVGVNTVSPGEYLVVKMGGSTWLDPHFSLENFNTTDKWDMTIGNKKKLFLGYNETSKVVVDTLGKVGIGIVSPSGELHVSGEDGVLFEGTEVSGTIPKEGGGTRMMWYPGKAAFRVGSVTGTHWDDTNISLFSVAMGSSTIARGYASTAFGAETVASGEFSTAFGSLTNAGGYASTTFGINTISSGFLSTSMGQEIEAAGDYTFAIGLNDQNGTVVSQDNTMAIMGGKVGIGEVAPTGDLEVKGTDGVLFDGTFGVGSIPSSGVGTRMMWYPTKAAFRAGYVGSTRWDDVNIGDYSIAMGWNTMAKGHSSTALGDGTSAPGASSTAMGYYTTAEGYHSTAIGHSTTASGFYSTAMGSLTTASGDWSTAIGREIEAAGDYTLAIALSDQFGTVVNQHNTMAIMGGKVGIGDISPEASLEIHSSGTTEDPLRVRVGSATKLRVWASNGSVSLGANVIGPDDGLLVKGNINPSVHKGADLGANGTAWDDIYYDDLHNQGASAFDGRVLTKEIIKFPPLPKKPGSFDYLTERGDVELDPASMPPGLADENSLLTDEITSYNYKANYEQQMLIEALLNKVNLLEKRIDELEKLLKK